MNGGTLILLVYINAIHSQNGKQTKKKFQFEDFTKKFDPSYIWEQIDRKAAPSKANLSNAVHTEALMTAMDPTDELLSFKVENGNADLIRPANGRRGGWVAPNDIYTARDPFHVRRRLLELMKQAIYHIRNKLVFMQAMRKKYNTSNLYRMGFLFSKVDAQCKTFSLFSFRAFRLCMIRRQHMRVKHTLYDALQTNERQLQHWFNIDLLVDLIELNDANCKKILKEPGRYKKRLWKFVD